MTFEINPDCILTVSAVDKATGREQSIRIDGAIVLNPTEKETLKKYFSDREALYDYEKDLKEAKEHVGTLKSSCLEAANISENLVKSYLELFKEKIETNFKLYTVDEEQTRKIQKMFLDKDSIINDIAKYRDRFSTISHNIDNIIEAPLDFNDNDIALGIQNKIEILSKQKNELEKAKDSFEKNIINILAEWINILKSLLPNFDIMKPVESARYLMSSGKYAKARTMLEELIKDNLSHEVFGLLLRSYVQLGLREEYRSVYKKHSPLLSISQPDFNSLNKYLKNIDDSVYMIYSYAEDGRIMSGSGFAIGKNIIATNRHVVEESKADTIKIIGKDQTYIATKIKKDPTNDIAYIYVDSDLEALRIGEFNFVEPGEQVLAVGFPSPDSDFHSENLYVSKGIVNSIRHTDLSSERVIFIDAKIGRGMSGGPLINDLGEIIGIITLIKYGYAENAKGIIALENQPIALPIHLVLNHLQVQSSL